MSPDTLLHYAQTRLASGCFAEAEQACHQVLALDPHHPEASYTLGLLSLQQGQSSHAVTWFEAARDAQPDQAVYWLGYVEALLCDQQHGLAEAVLAEGCALGLAGENVDALWQALAEAAQPAAAVVQALLAAFEQADYAEAERLARPLTLEYPLHPLGWTLLGASLKQLGRLEEALPVLRQVVNLLPEEASAHSNVGSVLLSLDQLEAAEQSLRYAITLQPDYPNAYNHLGSVLKRQSRLAESEASLRQALALSPDYAEAHYNLGITLEAAGQVAAAEQVYRDALVAAPNLAEAWNNLGELLQEYAPSPESEACLLRAVELNPRYADALSNLGKLCQSKGQAIEAEGYYRSE